MQQGLGPGVNQITPPPASLRVDFVPSFVRQEDFQRLFLQLEGCTDARLVARFVRGAWELLVRAAGGRRRRLSAS